MIAGTNRIITPLIVAFILATTAPTFVGQIIYVDDDAPADFKNIQVAINYSNHGDTIIVAEGRYFENINFNGRNITLTSTDPCSPDVVAATIIDGRQNGSVVTFNRGEDENCVLNGFTITNGNAEYGGGIYFRRRHGPPCPPPGPPPPPPPPGQPPPFPPPLPPPECNFPGPTFKNCIISNNSAYSGGGMYNEDSRWSESKSGPTLINCVFNGNSASGSGGGISNYYSSPTLTNCTFTDNSAAVISSWKGGGGGMFNDYSNPILNNCTFSCNSSVQRGGGMYNKHSAPIVTNSTFSGNSTVGTGQYYGCGVGMYNNRSSPIVANCTFTGNTTGSLNGGGGGMGTGQGSHPMVINCIFWENIVYNRTGELAQILGTPFFIINYSCIQGWTGTLGGTGNMGADPCFVDLGYWDSNDTPDDTMDDFWIEGDYHLLPDSPCINAGDPNHLYDPNKIDLDGNPRVIGCRTDMGAFEYRHLVPAEVKIVPRSINLANRGKWITALLWFPENYNVAEIDFCILLLEDEIEPVQLFINEKEQVIMARFNQEQLKGILEAGDLELTISAQLTDATIFEGTDVIKVIYEGGGRLAKLSGKASNPNPADGATDVFANVDLSWTPGYNAASHDVYFGTADPPPFIGNQTVATFDPGMMVFETTYYWRIDEINKWSTTTGDLWNFTTNGPPPPPPPPPPWPPM